MTDDISVQRFFDVIEQSGIFMHGAVMMENNRVVAQRYWRPFSQNKLHRMYSVTKSFVSVSIGMLSDEGKLKLSDKVVPIFRQELGLFQLHPYIEDMTIRDLLMMAAPFGKLTYGENDRDWLKSMFVSTPDHPPGTVFRYDSGASYVLGAIVKRKSGKNFVEYMRPLFDKIGFSKEAYCLQGPDGEMWSGSGLMASTLDLAKFAQLLVNRGKWNGEQVVSEEYVTEATKMQICNFDDGNDSAWNRGYGYQIWILKDNAFFLNGMGGQLAIGFPKHNFVFACTADVQGNPCGKDVILNALWNEIVS